MIGNVKNMRFTVLSISIGKLSIELWTILWCWPKLNLVSDIIMSLMSCFGWKMLKSKPNFIRFWLLFVIYSRICYEFMILTLF